MTVTEKGHQQSLGVSMDQSIPIEVLPNDRLAAVVNARARKPGGLYKRYGYTARPRTKITDGTNILTGKRFIRRENELVFTDGSYVYSYAEGLAKWVRRDRMPECQVLDHQAQVAQITKGSVIEASVAHINGQTCVLYFRFETGITGAEVWARVFRDSTLISETRLATGMGDGEVITCGGTFVVLYDDGTNDLIAHTWDTLDATNPTWTGPTSIRNNTDSSGFWAAAEIPALNQFAIAYRQSGGGNQLNVYTYNASLVQQNQALNQRAGKVFQLIGMRVIGTTLVIGIQNTTDGTVDALGLVASTLAAAMAATVVLAAIADISGPLIVGEQVAGASAWIMVRALGSGGAPFVNQPGIRYRGISVPTAVLDANTYNTYNCRHISHIWNYNGQSYVTVQVCATNPMGGGDLTQTAAVVLNLGTDEILAGDANYRGRPVARWGEGDLYDVTDRFPTRVPAWNTAGTFRLALIPVDPDFLRLGLSRGVGVDVITLNFDDTAGVRWVGQCQIGGDTLIPAGMLHCYDGELCFEAGFSYYPIIRGVETFNGSPGLAVGTYEYVVCFVKRDKQGRIWRSRPSLPVSQVLGEDDAIRLRITHYSITSMHDSANGFAHPVGIEVYRRQGTAPFIRLAGSADPTTVAQASDPTAQPYFVFEDQGNWVTTNQPELYTTGGVLENITPPPCRYSTVFDNRVWLAGCDDDEIAPFSREVIDGEGAFFASDQEFRVDEGQGIKALAVQDSSLLLLKDDNDGIFYIQGSGPNDFGFESTYTDPRKIANAHGCVEPRSVLTTTAGTFFQSRRGIELIGRGEGVQLFGAPIEDTLASLPTITSCVYEPSAGEMRWTMTNGTDGQVGVFTEPTKTWAIDLLFGGNGKRATDAMMLAGVYHWLGPDGYVYQETPTSYFDLNAGASLALVIPSAFVTGDIALAGPLGKVSHFRVALLGKHIASNSLTFTIYLDQGQTLAASKTFTAVEVAAFKWFPIELPLVNLTTQQGRSIRVQVFDGPEGEVGTGAIWFWLLVEYGTEREYQPLPVPPRNRK
jgi:hypothetical protein